MNFNKLARKTSDLVGSAAVCVFAFLLIVAWTIVAGIFFQYSTESQLPINTITTIITFLLVFLIQHSQNQDTKALHAKLDALIKVNENIDDALIGVERQGTKTIQKRGQEALDNADDV